MREIALDTETTGLDPKSGHRIVEIGCVEMINKVRTGSSYHTYLNPERDMPEEAFRIHGIAGEFLRDKPLFSAVAKDFLAFIGDSPLIIHNAAFDMKFLNAELAHVKIPSLSSGRVLDTLLLARKKFPGSPANLDALCRRFNIDLSSRTKHGALLDAELLALVYLELTGGSQSKMELNQAVTNIVPPKQKAAAAPIRPPRPHTPTPEELAAHAEFMKNIKNALWGREVQ